MGRCARGVVSGILFVVLAAWGIPSIASGSPDGPERSIVRVVPSADPQDVARDHGVNPERLYAHALDGFAGPASASQRASLRRDARVLSVEDDRLVTAVHHKDGHDGGPPGGGDDDDGGTTQPAEEVPTGVARIDAQDAADLSNAGFAVAVIDTGIDLDHPDLNVGRGVDCTRGPNCSKGGDGDDGNGHGTHVAGTIGAVDNDIGVVGVAPGVELWAVKVLRDDGTGFLSDVIAGIDYVTEHANTVAVANMSLGWTGNSDSARTAVQNSVGAGVVYTVAAGNDDQDVYGDDGAFGTSDDFEPASYPEAAAISALSDTDGAAGGDGDLSSWGGEDRDGDGFDDGLDDSFAFFSNFSESVVADNPVSSPGKAIDLLMPGVDIRSTVPDDGYDTFSGTSMASPHAAGLVALYADANGRATDATGVASIRQDLIDTGKGQVKDGKRLVSDYVATEPDSTDGEDDFEPLGWE